MREPFNAWVESMRFACEVQGVVAMAAAAGARRGEADAEAQLMIAEKIAAFADAEIAMAQALSAGEDFLAAAERGYAPLRRCVSANSRHLALSAA